MDIKKLRQPQKLTKKFFLELPTGVYLVSNCYEMVSADTYTPAFYDYVVASDQARDPRKLISRGKPIGPNQWIVELNLRQQRHKKYNEPTLPRQLSVRLIRIRFLHHGKPKLTWLVTTLLDPNRYPQTDIMKLYRARWGIETRLGELKTTLQMNILRSKGAQAARCEVAATVLGYNLLRTVIHQAAKQNQIPADRISFATAIKMILAYSMSLRILANS